MSTLPLGGHGTTILTGLLGKFLGAGDRGGQQQNGASVSPRIEADQFFVVSSSEPDTAFATPLIAEPVTLTPVSTTVPTTLAVVETTVPATESTVQPVQANATSSAAIVPLVDMLGAL